MTQFERFDFNLIKSWIKTNSRILDLGCGDGSLIESLTASKNIQGYGIESDPGQIQKCVEKGVSVLEQNIDLGLSNFDDQTFDVVLMNQAIQELSNPRQLLQDMLRVGKTGIITFPNFGFLEK